jgi:site-specific DNA recombinase
MARNYSQNLGEETVKGMTEKACAGIYPSCAPVGYRNADGPSGKRVIVSDPDAASMITELFGRFATGRYSLKVLVKEVNGEGLKLRGRKLYSSVIHQILRKRLYTGDFDWDGSTYTGSHEPLVIRECWQRVQELLDARAENRTRKVKHDFAYTGLVHCGHCGCLFVGELKKRKYVYYHCTGHRGKCEEPYTRQELLAREFAEVLQELIIPQAILEWLGNDVLTSDQTEQAVETLRLTSRASELFLQQPAAEQRRLLQVVIEKAAWQDDALRTTLFEPFEILRHSNQESYRKENNGESGRDLGIWLRGPNSNTDRFG